jgi:hypothetical protein
MATTSIDKEIEKFLPLLGKDEKQAILSVIKSFMKLREAPLASMPISIEQYNKEIDEAMERIANGQFYTQEEVEKMSEKW